MIPPFTDSGWLPPGVHRATLDEIALHFGTGSEIRRVQLDSIRWMIDLARRAGAERIILNGSFTTDIMEPNDVDCVLLARPDLQLDAEARSQLKEGLPFLEILVTEQEEFDYFVNSFFAFDRFGLSKGMIEVVL